MQITADDLIPERYLFEASDADLERGMEVVFEHRREIGDWANRWKTFYTGTVTPESIAAWILQHCKSEAVLFALQILQAIRFVDENEVASTLRDLYERLSPEGTKRFYQPGGMQDSSGVVAYSFAKYLGLPEAVLAKLELRRLEDISETDSNIVILDDNIASGTQARDTLNAWMGLPASGETDAIPLSGRASAVLRNAHIQWLFVAGLGEGPEVLETHGRALGLNLSVQIGLRDAGDAFQYIEPRVSASAIGHIASLGKLLNRQKQDWSDARRVANSLGHGNLARRVVFAHNTPKNLLSTLWRYGAHASGVWIPLFAERDVWRLHQRDIRTASGHLRALARKVLSGVAVASKDELTPVFEVDARNANDELTLDAGRIPRIHEQVRAITSQVKRPERLVPRSAERVAFDRAAERVAGFVSAAPSAREIAQYNERADRFLDDLEELPDKLTRELDEISRTFSFRLIVRNDGTVFAEDVTLEIEFPRGIRASEVPIEYLGLSPMPRTPVAPKGGSSMLDVLNFGGSASDVSRLAAALHSSAPRPVTKPYERRDDTNRLAGLSWDLGDLRQGHWIELTVPPLVINEGRHAMTWAIHSKAMPSWRRGTITLDVVRTDDVRQVVSEAIDNFIVAK